ncbi:uncharacterized protein LOC119558917 [Drosophila subpulchrella]|uniref:uncharacterized protein LOC119558917 n=1 Tax=Drosophila subpulchrella TaxID=1486046 RepID=UPI0018A149E8|nr:uncharacterized protein LOC119558917 [Drosophila subpulchrella]
MVNTMRWKLTILWLFVSVYAAPVIRWRRQIVTPKHLMGPPLPTGFQGKVVITPQKLREVADLRATIHKAIDEDTYVVAAPPSQDFLASLGGSWPTPLFLTQPWSAPALNFTILWPRFG